MLNKARVFADPPFRRHLVSAFFGVAQDSPLSEMAAQDSPQSEMAAHLAMPQLMLAASLALELTEQGPVNMMQPVAGCHPLFSVEDFAARMKLPAEWKEGEPYPEYKGTAHSIFALAMGDAIPGAPVSMHEVRSYQEAHFAKLKANEAVRWEHTVTVVVAEDDASRYNPNAPAFRKISMDVMIFAFLQELQKRREIAERGCIPVNFLQAARHLPVNYVLIPASAAHEEHVYVFSLQIMEDFRTAEEEHAPRAWQLCQIWAQARAMTQKSGAPSEDPAAAVAEVLKRVRCSKNCDYADKGIIMKRVVQDALNVYDRVLAADIGDALSYAGAEFGPRSPLTSMSKLVKLSQAVQAAASARKTSPPGLLKRTIQVMLLRLQLSLTDQQEGINALGKTEIPRCILIGELLAEAASRLPSLGQPVAVQNVILALGTSLPKPSAVEAAAREALHQPVKAGLSWVLQILMGQLDAVLREMVHQDIKKSSAKQLLLHGKLGWVEDVQPKLDSDAEAQKRQAVVFAAAAQGVPDEDQDIFVSAVLVAASAAASPQTMPALADNAGEASTAEAATTASPSSKGEALQATSPAEARAAYAKSALDKFLIVDVGPELGAGVADWQVLLEKISAGSSGVSRNGFQLHAWVLDAASDAEPVLKEEESVFARPPPVNKVLAERFFKAAGRNTGPEKHFMLLAPAGGAGAAGMLTKIMTEEPFEEAVADHLNILYKETSKGRGQRRSRTKLLERVLGFVSKAAVAAAAAAPVKKCNRLHFTATSTMSDSIINAPPPAGEHQPRLTLDRKAKVLSPGGLLRGEDLESKPAVECILLHHEKAPELWAEVFHHYRVSSIATATPGSGAMLKGAIGLEIPAAALCKNEEHKAFLLEQLLEWAVRESRRPHSWCYAADSDLGIHAEPAKGSPSEGSESGADPGEEEEEEEEASDEEAEESPGEEEELPASRQAKVRAGAKAVAASLKAKAAAAKKKAQCEGDAPLAVDEKKTAGATGRNKKTKAEPKKKVQQKAPSESAKKLSDELFGQELCSAEPAQPHSKASRRTKRSALEAALQDVRGGAPAEVPPEKRKKPVAAAPAGVVGALANFRTSMAGGGFLPRL